MNNVLASMKLLLSLVIFGNIEMSVDAFTAISTRSAGHRGRPVSSYRMSTAGNKNPKILKPDEIEASVQPLMQLASAHFASQATRAIVELGIPDMLGDSKMTTRELASQIGGTTNKDALLRTMRLLVAVGILEEDKLPAKEGKYESTSFGLTSTGALLQTNVPGQPSLAPCLQHWMEQPLWDPWLELPDFIAGEKGDLLPFDRANGMSSDEFYGQKSPDSLKYANEFVRFISEGEVDAVLAGYDWNALSGKTVVDIGGHHGGIMSAVDQHFPDVKCVCLDLPEVVASAPPSTSNVELVGGDVLDPSTIPACHAIFMKHILDKSMWNKQESMDILKSCYAALPVDGRVIIGDAVLPNNAAATANSNQVQLQLFIDVLFLLVGREGARTESEWTELAQVAGFEIESITATSSPSCYIIVLAKAGAANRGN